LIFFYLMHYLFYLFIDTHKAAAIKTVIKVHKHNATEPDKVDDEVKCRRE